MKKNTPVSKIMATEIVSASLNQKPSEVRKMMTEHNIHHVPITSGSQLVGLLSASDLLRLSFGAYGSDEREIDSILDHQFSLEEIMTKELTTLSSKGTVREAAEILSSGSFHSLPVVDGGKLVGIVTSTDLIRYLLSQF